MSDPQSLDTAAKAERSNELSDDKLADSRIDANIADLKAGLLASWGRALPVRWLARSLTEWFAFDDAKLVEILTKIKTELPTTEALLIGKPQAGKSSIVRGLTGGSADIVGQGFRPHTRYTQRYSYPTEELPLLVFTDTVGLGDITQETETVVTELLAELAQPNQRGAKVIVLTVKITDFATDTLHQVASQIRQHHPEVPCLLVVTCLHEIYPPSMGEHPAYPPNFEALDRAFSGIQQTFAGLYDRAVLLDFTLESDGFEPVFYGLEALVNHLAELLPEAEARVMEQLLVDEGKQLGDLYRDAGRRYILPFTVMAMALAAVPLPFATMPVLTALQVSMVGLLGKLYGQTLSPSQAGGIVGAIAGGFLAQAIARELIKFIPGLGSVIAASWAGAYTWALGEAACVYFGDVMGGKQPDAQRIQEVMRESFSTAKERFQQRK
jgi:uncharacterized protein (DUF697 family)/predicted GTPase